MARRYAGLHPIYENQGMAEFVPLAETVKTAQAILNGELDEVPEDALLNIGKWSPAWT